MMAADFTSLAIGLIADAQVEPLPRPSYLQRLEIVRKSEDDAMSYPSEALAKGRERGSRLVRSQLPR